MLLSYPDIPIGFQIKIPIVFKILYISLFPIPSSNPVFWDSPSQTLFQETYSMAIVPNSPILGLHNLSPTPTAKLHSRFPVCSVILCSLLLSMLVPCPLSLVSDFSQDANAVAMLKGISCLPCCMGAPLGLGLCPCQNVNFLK